MKWISHACRVQSDSTLWKMNKSKMFASISIPHTNPPLKLSLKMIKLLNLILYHLIVLECSHQSIISRIRHYIKIKTNRKTSRETIKQFLRKIMISSKKVICRRKISLLRCRLSYYHQRLVRVTHNHLRCCLISSRRRIFLENLAVWQHL